MPARRTSSLAKTSRSTTQREATGAMRLAGEGLHPVGVGAAEAQDQAEDGVVDPGGEAPEDRPAVHRAGGPLRAHHHVGLPAREDGQGAVVEAGVAEVDLVGDHEAAAGLEDAAAERLAVVGLGGVEVAQTRVVPGQLLEDGHGPVAGAVLGEEELVVPSPGVERRHELEAGRGDDPLLVVDGDDDAEIGGVFGHAVRSRSALQLPGHLPTGEQGVLHGGVLPVSRSPRHEDVALGEPVADRAPGRSVGAVVDHVGLVDGAHVGKPHVCRRADHADCAAAPPGRPARPRRAGPAHGPTSPRRSS